MALEVVGSSPIFHPIFFGITVVTVVPFLFSFYHIFSFFIDKKSILYYNLYTKTRREVKALKNVIIPAFGEECIENKENNTARVFVIKAEDEALFDSYVNLLLSSDFKKREEFERAGHRYAAFSENGESWFINYYHTVKELYIVNEKSDNYFDHKNEVSVAKSVTPQITQIDLEDFGLSYAVRLPDGRFIVFDGGHNFEPDHDKLFTCLKRGTFGRRPRIAGWILTHAHSDHFECFVGFMDKYADEVDIDAFYYLFPEHDDIAHFPELANKNPNVDFDSSPIVYIPKMREKIKKTGALVYAPHTGQTYKIGDAVCEILSSMDDIMHTSPFINATSLVIRMELGEQVILWAADASFGAAKLAEKHGAYLKSDILQVPHHGFGCGKPQAEIDAYNIIGAQTCLLPVSSYNAFIMFSTFKESTRHLMTRTEVEEIITGDPERTISLPYTPPPYARAELEKRVISGIDKCGATTWVFSDLSTDDPDDFVFTFLNMANVVKATVTIELFFDEKSKRIRNVKAEIAGGTVTRLSIIGDEVDSDYVYYNTYSLKKIGIPEHMIFSVRFISDTPLVITHKNHAPAYYTPNR